MIWVRYGTTGIEIKNRNYSWVKILNFITVKKIKLKYKTCVLRKSGFKLYSCTNWGFIGTVCCFGTVCIFCGGFNGYVREISIYNFFSINNTIIRD